MLVAVSSGSFVRVGGVGLAALAHYGGGQPYCMMEGVAFGAVYFTLGSITSQLALAGILYYDFMYQKDQAIA